MHTILPYQKRKGKNKKQHLTSLHASHRGLTLPLNRMRFLLRLSVLSLHGQWRTEPEHLFEKRTFCTNILEYRSASQSVQLARVFLALIRSAPVSMDVNLTISLMRGQMGAVIEKAVNVAVETVLGEMIRVVGLKFEEIKRDMTAKEKENENIRRMLEASRCQMKTMRKYISVLSAKDPNHRLYQGDGDMATTSTGLHCRRGPTSTVSVCAKTPDPCPRPRPSEPAPVAGPSWVRQQMHMSKETVRSEIHIADVHIEEIHGSSVHKVDISSPHLVDSQALLSETSDPVWGQNPLTSAETGHSDTPDTSVLSAPMMADESVSSQTTSTVGFGAPSLKIKQEEAEVEIVCVKDEHAESGNIPRFEYSDPELHQPAGEPELGVSLDLPASFQALQSPSTSADFALPAFMSVDPATSMSDVSPGSFENNQCTAAERAILESQGEMDWKINHLTALVQCLVGNRCFVPPLQMEDEEEDCVLPLMSMEDLDQLEQRLMDRAMMQKLVNRLSVSGGQTMKKTIWRICTKVFASNVAKQLNWCGRGDKRGLRKTNIGSLIIAAAMRNTVLLAPTEAEAEKCIKDYLRLAPGRTSS
uniref:Si:ch211-67e16.4 n=2 Tax=Cyprinus carpio TaxID=7962 RepID=A0A9J7YC87_CYPCA